MEKFQRFNPDLAVKLSVNAAVVFENVAYWCELNRERNENLHDGKNWVCLSIRELTETCPYISGRAIRFAIQKLVDAGLLVTGNYNERPFDKTLWYALTDKGMELYRHG